MNKLWQRRKQNKKKTAPLSTLIEQYIEAEFNGVAKLLPKQDQQELTRALMTILHSHRYLKTEQFMDGMDFSII